MVIHRVRIPKEPLVDSDIGDGPEVVSADAGYGSRQSQQVIARLRRTQTLSNPPLHG